MYFGQICLLFSPWQFLPYLPYCIPPPQPQLHVFSLSLFKYQLCLFNTASVMWGWGPYWSMGILPGPVFLKKTDYPSSGSHQFPHSFSDGMGRHEVPPFPHAGMLAPLIMCRRIHVVPGAVSSHMWLCYHICISSPGSYNISTHFPIKTLEPQGERRDVVDPFRAEDSQGGA